MLVKNVGITKALACEWAKERINVNAVAPGYIAGSCVFLSTKDADYLNGTIMNVDGAWLSR